MFLLPIKQKEPVREYRTYSLPIDRQYGKYQLLPYMVLSDEHIRRVKKTRNMFISTPLCHYMLDCFVSCCWTAEDGYGVYNNCQIFRCILFCVLKVGRSALKIRFLKTNQIFWLPASILRKAVKIKESYLLVLAAARLNFWPGGLKPEPQKVKAGRRRRRERGLIGRWEGAGSMKRKQTERAPKTKRAQGLWIDGRLCNSFVELITWVRHQPWPEASVGGCSGRCHDLLFMACDPRLQERRRRAMKE